MTTVLFVCTGNLCRSPMAEVVLRDELKRRGIDAEVKSAGVRPASRSVPEQALLVMRARGFDLSSHSTRGLGPADLADSAAIIAMDRSHVREIVAREPTAWPRTFTLKEFVRRAERVGPRQTSWNEWMRELHDGRDPNDALGSSSVDDIADPYGSDDAAYLATADEVVGLVERFAELAWPTASE